MDRALSILDCVVVDGYHTKPRAAARLRKKTDRQAQRKAQSKEGDDPVAAVVVTGIVTTVRMRLDRPAWTGLWLGIGLMLSLPVAILLVTAAVSAGLFGLAWGWGWDLPIAR